MPGKRRGIMGMPDPTYQGQRGGKGGIKLRKKIRESENSSRRRIKKCSLWDNCKGRGWGAEQGRAAAAAAAIARAFLDRGQRLHRVPSRCIQVIFRDASSKRGGEGCVTRYVVDRADKTRALQPATHVTNVTTAWQLLPTAVLSDGLHSSAE